MLISCAVTAQLICVFVLAYAKSRFSHNEAPIKHREGSDQTWQMSRLILVLNGPKAKMVGFVSHVSAQILYFVLPADTSKHI